MAVFTALTGGFPRTRKLANAVRRYEKRKISREEFEKIVLEETRKNVSRASRYLDYLTDGMYLCDDILNPFIKDIEGVKRGWLVRFYDNNFFVRNPIIVGSIRLSDNPESLLKRIQLVRELESGLKEKKFRIPIPGPLTFIEFAVIEKGSYSNHEALAKDYVAKVLKPTVDTLSKNGLIAEIHEPSLGSQNVKGINLRGIYDGLKEHEDNVHIIQYFNKPDSGDLAYLTNNFLIGVDLVENPTLIDTASKWVKGDTLQAGIVDARNTRIEDPDKTARALKPLIGQVGELLLSSNTTLEFLPEIPARRKIRILYSIKRRL